MDHLFAVVKDVDFKVNDEEIMATRWVDQVELREELNERPELYSPWFKIIVRDLLLKEGGSSFWSKIRNKATIRPLPDILEYNNPLE